MGYQVCRQFLGITMLGINELGLEGLSLLILMAAGSR